ncbi:MAG: permease [Pseudomonas sp.]
MELFKWLNDQLLRMDWLSWLVRVLLEDGFGLDMASRSGASLHFFIYDVIKIFILLSVLIFSISWVQSYFPPERTRRILGRMRGVRGNLMGALLGTITPFCSCSSIPLFIGFTGSGLPLGVTFSFLISSPLVDLASVILLASIFNWSIALAYVLVGIVLAVLGGSLISQAKMERYVEDFVLHNKILDLPPAQLTRRDRLQFSWEQVADVFSRVWLYVLIGVGIGAAIHNWIPQELITTLIGEDNWWSVPLATLVGVPMYADIFGTLPIAEALVAKGVGLGTALAFMMAVTALSLPSLIMLKKVVKGPLLALFFSIVLVGIVLIGYLFNSFAYLFI